MLTMCCWIVFARHYVAPGPIPASVAPSSDFRGILYGVGVVVLAGGLQVLFRHLM